MALEVGTRLGHYDVTALLGEGAWARSGRPVTLASRDRSLGTTRP